ncbi:MAG: aldehyde dehydrogenase family protein [Planctomycetota bacterium]|jgi:acetaldehyde dehydrogenase/alcohol dehydrogenase
MSETETNTDVAQVADELMMRAKTAAAVFSQYDQEATDAIVRAAFLAGLGQRRELAAAAVEETGMGNYPDKVLKNTVATLLVYDTIRDQKTVGVICEDRRAGTMEVAEPLGVVLGVTPVTNPAATVMFKILLALKTRNAIIISPHRRAFQCSLAAAKLLYEAALEAGAPEDCITWMTEPNREVSRALMGHSGLALILATGGSSLVNAAYSSGTPALGVGPGNVPVFADATADIELLADSVVASKTFDNGVICASEQSVVVVESGYDALVAAMAARGGYLCNEDERKKLEAVAIDTEKGSMSMDVIGQSAGRIASLAGIDVPEGTRLLLVEPGGVGPDFALSREKLSPILALYTATDNRDGINRCVDLLHFGGIGHTAGIFSNDDDAVAEFSNAVNAGRILVNQPTSQGAVGQMFNTIPTSLTLGCGTGGHNITTDNVTAVHLINRKRLLRRRPNHRFLDLPADMLDSADQSAEAIEQAYRRNY